MENLSKEAKEEIISMLERINKIADNLKSVCKNNYRSFLSPCSEIIFYQQFTMEISDELRRINDIVEYEEHRLPIEIGAEFIDWADGYFEYKLDMIVEEESAMEDYKLRTCRRFKIDKSDFNRKLVKWCEFRNYEYNPEYIMKSRTDVERTRNIILSIIPEVGKVRCFYIGSKRETK